MATNDPKKKDILGEGKDYDKDGKITNSSNTVREGQEDSSILEDKDHTSEADYAKLNVNSNDTKEQEEYIDLSNDKKTENE
jgi:hypothetical protein